MDEETIQLSGSDEQVKLDLPQERPQQVKERPTFLEAPRSSPFQEAHRTPTFQEAPRTGRRHRAMRGGSISGLFFKEGEIILISPQSLRILK